MEQAQNAFLFKTKPEYNRQDFMVSGCNKHALQSVEAWPKWPLFALCIYGPKGCGKTHLAHIFKEHVRSVLEKPVEVGILQAVDVKTKKTDYIHQTYPYLVVENVTQKVDEEGLFHLFNLYQNEGGYILFTSQIPLARMNFRLPDLKSRLKMVPSVPIGEPDDQMLEALIVKLFSDRQICLRSDVLNYIIQNMERSFAYALKLVERSDELSLALKRAVTIPVVKKAMYDIAHNTQQELF